LALRSDGTIAAWGDNDSGECKVPAGTYTQVAAGRGHSLALESEVVPEPGSALLMALLFQPGHDPSRVYYGTDTRAQSLLVGALLAMLLTHLGPVKGRWPRLALEVAAIGCAAGIGWTWMHATGGDTLLYRGGFLMLALGVAETLVLARRAGLDPGRTLEAIGAGAGSSWMLLNQGPKMVARDFAPGFFIRLQQKDLRLVLEAAA
jgi:hypothetical protein